MKKLVRNFASISDRYRLILLIYRVIKHMNWHGQFPEPFANSCTITLKEKAVSESANVINKEFANIIITESANESELNEVINANTFEPIEEPKVLVTKVLSRTHCIACSIDQNTIEGLNAEEKEDMSEMSEMPILNPFNKTNDNSEIACNGLSWEEELDFAGLEIDLDLAVQVKKINIGFDKKYV